MTRSHRLGFAVKVLGGGGLPSHDARRWQSGPHLSVSLDRLEAILDYCHGQGIAFYRMVSSFVPYATHPGLPQFHGQVEACSERLAQVGARAREQAIRLTSHPSQYVVLNSEEPRVVDAAIRDLELPRSRRNPGPRRARARAGHLARGRDAQDPLLVAQDRRRGAQQEGRPPPRALAQRGIASEAGRLVVEDDA